MPKMIGVTMAEFVSQTKVVLAIEGGNAVSIPSDMSNKIFQDVTARELVSLTDVKDVKVLTAAESFIAYIRMDDHGVSDFEAMQHEFSSGETVAGDWLVQTANAAGVAP